MLYLKQLKGVTPEFPFTKSFSIAMCYGILSPKVLEAYGG